MNEPKRNKKTEYLHFTSPTGDALFAALISPDIKFNEKGIYKVWLVMDVDDPEAEEFKAYIDEEVKRVFEKEFAEAKPKMKKKMFKHFPYELATDEETGEETGKIFFKFSSNASYLDKKKQEEVKISPRLFDKFGKPFDRKSTPFVGNGSLIQVAGFMKPFNQASTGLCGVSMKLSAVLIKELVTGGGSAENYGFDLEEDEWADVSEEDMSFSEEGEDVGNGDF